MKAAIIFTGSELIRGKPNRDAVYLGTRLDDLGIECEFFTVVDDRKTIVDFLRFAFPRADLIITVGGLGPTFDDVTVDAVSDFTGRKRALSADALRSIADFFVDRGRDMPKETERCAYVLSGARLLKNTVGFAVPQILNFKKTDIILLPGPPAEVKAVLKSQVSPYLEKKVKAVFFRKRKFRITGMTESQVSEKIAPIVNVEKFSGLEVDFSIVSHSPVIEIDFRVRGGNEVLVEDRMRHLENEFRAALGDSIYAEGNSTLASACGRLLSRKRRSLSTVESCTGGQIADIVTDVKGASAYFDAAFVVYTERQKSSLLGIPSGALKKEGVVSAWTASALAESALKITGSYYVLSTTGVAGPGPAGGVKAGTVFIALAARGAETRCAEFHFKGSRQAVKKKAAMAALDMLRRDLLGV